MEKAFDSSKLSLGRKALYIFVTVSAAVILPQIVHAAGVLTGTGAALGQALMPMYLPVILLGFCVGPSAGAAAGIISPILSYAISGMPAAALLPFMTAELFCFGLFAGLIKNAKMNFALKVLAVCLAGRFVRIVITAASVYIFGVGMSALTMAVNAIIAGIPGIVIQILLVPIIVKKAEKSGLC